MAVKGWSIDRVRRDYSGDWSVSKATVQYPFSIGISQGVYTFLTPFSEGWQLQGGLLPG
jgi:hypothetical protein